MNLMKLQIVELIDRHHHMTSVAEILGIKQPTVTFHMKSLEEELQVRLFESRSGKTFYRGWTSSAALCGKINALAKESERVVREYDSLYRGTRTLEPVMSLPPISARDIEYLCPRISRYTDFFIR